MAAGSTLVLMVTEPLLLSFSIIFSRLLRQVPILMSSNRHSILELRCMYPRDESSRVLFQSSVNGSMEAWDQKKMSIFESFSQHELQAIHKFSIIASFFPDVV